MTEERWKEQWTDGEENVELIHKRGRKMTDNFEAVQELCDKGTASKFLNVGDKTNEESKR